MHAHAGHTMHVRLNRQINKTENNEKSYPVKTNLNHKIIVV